MNYDISAGSIAHKITQMLLPCPCCGITASAACFPEHDYDRYPSGFTVYIYCNNCRLQTPKQQSIKTLAEAEQHLQTLRDIWNFRQAN
jgi:hypothetical protein